MTYQLICEGACNPMLPDLDAAVRRERKDDPLKASPITSVSEGLVARLHKLKHTAHSMVGDVHAKCDMCGTVRRYGGRPSAKL